jgi:two-component system, sensor histidine kinase and response regulator
VTHEGPSSAGQPEKRLLLLAEDNLINQKVALAILSNAGYRVDTVPNGVAAVEAATARRYDAILMDCQMPELDGYEATAAIRAAEGSARRTPIIAMTAGARREDQERCLAGGMDDYLTKPVSLKALATVLARWVPDGSGPTVAVAVDVDVDASDDLPPIIAGVDHGPHPSRPVLDARVVGRLERLGEKAGEDLMGQLAVLFLADADARVVALRQALAGDDAGAVVRSAHTLSGASANLGATDLARLCATLATDSAAGDLAGRRALLEEVETELGRVRSALGSPTPAP